MSCHECLGRMLSPFARRRCPKSNACTPAPCPSGAAAAAATPRITKKLCTKGDKVEQNLCWEWPGVNQHWLRGACRPRRAPHPRTPHPASMLSTKNVLKEIPCLQVSLRRARHRRSLYHVARAAAPKATQGTKPQNRWRGAHYIRQGRRPTEGSCCTAAAATVN